MIANRKNLEEPIERIQEDELTRAERILLEIGEDARRLKSRYSKETVVPEGGE
jgi:vacuolar-type H+-ATPase subunit E/Vma4